MSFARGIAFAVDVVDRRIDAALPERWRQRPAAREEVGKELDRISDVDLSVVVGICRVEARVGIKTEEDESKQNIQPPWAGKKAIAPKVSEASKPGANLAPTPKDKLPAKDTSALKKETLQKPPDGSGVK